ncbi:hypothetical protein Dimus_006411 [Dionaea muscipula]
MEKGSASTAKESVGGEELSTLGLVEVIVSSEREGLSLGSQGLGVGEREQVMNNPKPYLRAVHNTGNQEETGTQSLIQGVECRMELPVSRKPVMEWMRKPETGNQEAPKLPMPSATVAGNSAGPSKVNVWGDSIQDWQMAEGRLCIGHKMMPIGQDNQQKDVIQANQFGGLSEDGEMMDCSEVTAGNSSKDGLAHDLGGLECLRSE